LFSWFCSGGACDGNAFTSASLVYGSYYSSVAQFFVVAPVSGTYTYIPDSCQIFIDGVQSSGTPSTQVVNGAVTQDQSKSAWFSASVSGYDQWTGNYVTVSWTNPQYVVTNTGVDTSSTYSASTRPAVLVGDYIVVQDGGTVNIIEDQPLVDEDAGTWYNPITDNSITMDSWIFDYTTRTYNITYSAAEGETTVTKHATVTYGDESITITDDGVSSEVYYYAPDEGGGESGGEDDSDFFTWLRDWLQSFKTWLGEKLDALLSTTEEIADQDHSINVTEENEYNYNITYEDEEGEEQQTSLRDIIDRFGWWKDVYEIGQTFVAQVTANEEAAHSYSRRSSADAMLLADGELGTMEVAADVPAAPSITVNLGAAQSRFGYAYGGEVEVLDLSWYTPYKATVDNIVGGFLWLLFLWGLFKQTPNIISGSGMIENRSEDLQNGYRAKKGRRS